MGRPAKVQAISTPDRLLDAAEQEFAALGFALARLADIAERAGIRRPSLLYHFPSKDLLYRAVVERVFDQLSAVLLRSLAREGDIAERIDAVVQAFLEFLAERPSLAPIIVREVIAEPDPARPEGSHGRTILLERVVPLLGMLEDILRREGGDRLRDDLPVRAALAEVAGGLLLRSAAGTLRAPLWGAGDHSLALARHLFLRDSNSPDPNPRDPKET
ncbi:TetR/AcrR family transcriptional regulator [Nannocystaceae bacterium ST9]